MMVLLLKDRKLYTGKHTPLLVSSYVSPQPVSAPLLAPLFFSFLPSTPLVALLPPSSPPQP